MAVMSGDVVAELERVLPAGRVVRDADELASYAHDEAEWAPYGRPAAQVRPRETADVREVVAVCAARGVPEVARGACTGLSGGANALDGCVVITFEAMNAVLRIDPDERLAVVQPGVVNDDLRSACAEQGLWFLSVLVCVLWSLFGGFVAA